MEAFIFLFCWSANVLKGEGEKNNAMKAELKKEESFQRIFHSRCVPGGYAGPVFIAFIGEDMKEPSYAPTNSHFCSAPRGKTQFGF